MIIVYHTFIDTGLCRQSITDISRIHGLIRNHTSERYKILRKKGWCKNEKGAIRPLVGLKSPKIGVPEVQKSDFASPIFGLAKSKNRTNENENSPKIGLSSIPYTEPLKPEPNTEPPAPKEKAVGGSQTNGHLSEFSMEEILRYIEIRQNRGEHISNPHGLATKAFKSGELDAFIKAILYPEKTAAASADDRLADGLKMLIEIEAEGDDVNDFKKWYSEDEWQWLMSELAKQRATN